MEDPIPYFEDHSVDEIYSEIQTVYKSDSRPWIIGYSGGKDSTTALQLIWYAIEDLPPSERTKQIYVISSDTLVEIPVIVDYIDNSLLLASVRYQDKCSILNKLFEGKYLIAVLPLISFLLDTSRGHLLGFSRVLLLVVFL